MTNEEKLELLKKFLDENGIRYDEHHRSGTNVIMDLQIPDYMIAVHLSNDFDDTFYRMVYRVYHPFFIRESESAEFVLEKMQNCITDIMVKRQAKFEAAQKKEENRRKSAEDLKRHAEKLAKKAAEQKPKRQRMRIVRYEKVERRYERQTEAVRQER